MNAVSLVWSQIYAMPFNEHKPQFPYVSNDSVCKYNNSAPQKYYQGCLSVCFVLFCRGFFLRELLRLMKIKLVFFNSSVIFPFKFSARRREERVTIWGRWHHANRQQRERAEFFNSLHFYLFCQRHQSSVWGGRINSSRNGLKPTMGGEIGKERL